MIKIIIVMIMSVFSIVLSTSATAASVLDELTHGFDVKIELIYFIRIILAVILGSIIGILNNRRKINVGLQTYGSVALGSSVFSVISLHIFLIYNNDYAITIAAGIVTGIGFLGAGVIFKEGNSVKGLSAAALIWATAAIGLACGMGSFVLAIGGAILILIFQLLSYFTDNSD